ncbi:MAG: hypothetical protein ACYDBV_04735 [Nitrospiria bacterium]
MGQKEDLEIAACEFFLKSFNIRQGSQFEIISHRDKPDFEVLDRYSEETFYLEVTHLYCNTEETKYLLGKPGNSLYLHSNIACLIDTLNHELEKKVQKSIKYSDDKRLVLLVRVACPEFGMNDFERFERDIIVPTVNVFGEIWLLFWDPKTDGFNDLFPIQ